MCPERRDRDSPNACAIVARTVPHTLCLRLYGFFAIGFPQRFHCAGWETGDATPCAVFFARLELRSTAGREPVASRSTCGKGARQKSHGFLCVRVRRVSCVSCTSCLVLKPMAECWQRRHSVTVAGRFVNCCANISSRQKAVAWRLRTELKRTWTRGHGGKGADGSGASKHSPAGSPAVPAMGAASTPWRPSLCTGCRPAPACTQKSDRRGIAGPISGCRGSAECRPFSIPRRRNTSAEPRLCAKARGRGRIRIARSS